ncbi:MAG: hypothetical protein EAZ85_06045 [Bacteroidetes bacterium]|nr:MAG: hypothetical protein EAZ85_06045 [Bacteroidota bacterium]TAG89804.1 MAG: hypothetical protein EAZ20_05680 [Bacteroidota bacterium]
MSSFFFWREWQKSTQIMYIFLLLLFFTNIFLVAYTYFVGLEKVIPFVTQDITQILKYSFAEINLGMFNIPLEGEMFSQRIFYQVEALKLQPIYYYIFGGIFLVILAGLLATLSEMKFIPYAIGMGIFIFWLSGSNLNLLRVLPENMLFIVSVVILGGISYFFQSIYTKLNAGIRFLTFLVALLGWAYFVNVSSSVRFPLLFVVVNSLWLPIILTIFFVILTAFEIVRSFFYLLVKYNAQGGSQNITHFSILSGIYWFNLLFLYFDFTGYFRTGLFLPDILIFFGISSILGVWGFCAREPIYIPFFNFKTTGAFLYILLGLIAFSTLNFFFFLGNESFILAIKEFILYAYLGFGATFYVYLIFNFPPLMRDSQPVHKVMFEGISFDFVWARYFALATIIGLSLASGHKSYYRSFASISNLKADVYFIHSDFQMANYYYEQSFYNDYSNVRACYGLATLSSTQKNFSDQVNYLKNALIRLPNEQSYLRLAALLVEDERPKDAIFLLRSGINNLPKSSKIANNLALLYAEENKPDSTFYFLRKAKKYASDDIPEANLVAYFASSKVVKEGKEALKEININKDNLVGQMNLMALYNNYQQNFEKFDNELWKKSISKKGFGYVYNYALNRNSKDSSALKILKEYDNKDATSQFGTRLQFATAFTHYYKGNAEKGIQAVVSMPILKTEPYFNTVAGLWLAEQGEFVAAETYFAKAVDLENSQAMLYQAIALSEAGKIEKALPIWEKIIVTDGISKESKEQAVKVLRVLGDSAKINDDIDRYNFLHYQQERIPLAIKKSIFDEIKNEYYKIKIATELVNYSLDLQDNETASYYFDFIKNPKTAHKNTNSAAQYAYLRYLLTRNASPRVLDEMEKMEWTGIYQYKKDFLKGVALQNVGNTKDAEKYFTNASLTSPYSLEVVLNSAEFYKNIKKDETKSYQILVESIRGRKFSLPLYKAYALQCLAIHLDNYAEDALNEIKNNAPNEYPNFEKIFKETKQKYNQNNENKEQI